ncbi:MAG: hypothetical protein BroJett003_27850 [Planctomycetota bacterium]|nr:MAG: hypothetical protein BroJett003_27850 [Planctomycetota bacterium]
MFIWDGLTTRQVTFDEEVSNIQAHLNDLGTIVWTRALFCENPWRSEIVLRSKERTLELDSPGSQNQVPRLSNIGDAVWMSVSSIMVWQKNSTFRLSSSGAAPDLNESGRVCFVEFDHDSRHWNPIVLDMINNTFDRYLIEDELGSFSTGSINGHGECVWRWYEDPMNGNWRGGVLLLRRQRTGDVDWDADVDLMDYAELARGLRGPLSDSSLCEDRFLDLDYDGDLDIADYAKFQNSFQRAVK